MSRKGNTDSAICSHPWICENGVAPDRALDPAVLSHLKQFSAMNKLKKMALRVISKANECMNISLFHLNKLEREEILVAAFRYFDKDGSGYIIVDELQQACAEHNMTDVFLDDIIKEVDQENVSVLYIDMGNPGRLLEDLTVYICQIQNTYRPCKHPKSNT
ncbi:hypothetical protein RYX36_023149 [Vicia faba]